MLLPSERCSSVPTGNAPRHHSLTSTSTASTTWCLSWPNGGGAQLHPGPVAGASNQRPPDRCARSAGTGTDRIHAAADLDPGGTRDASASAFARHELRQVGFVASASSPPDPQLREVSPLRQIRAADSLPRPVVGPVVPLLGGACPRQTWCRSCTAPGDRSRHPLSRRVKAGKASRSLACQASDHLQRWSRKSRSAVLSRCGTQRM